MTIFEILSSIPGVVCATALYALSIIIPLCAAIGKGVGNTFGLLCLLMGVTTLTLSMMSPAILVLGSIIALATILISLNMEGRAVHAWLCSFAFGKHESDADKDSKPPIKTTSWRSSELFGFFCGALVAIIAALSKGGNMAFGVLHSLDVLCSLDLSLTDPAGLCILLLAGLTIGLVSFGKEGMLFAQKLAGVSIGNAEGRGVSSACTRAFVGFMAALFPILAAFVKGFGYGYGTYRLFLLLSFNVFNPLVLTMLALIFAGVVLVSLSMEGKALSEGIKQLFLGDTPEKSEEKPIAALKFTPARTVLGACIPLLCAAGKGATMGEGTFGILVLVLGLPASSPLLISLCVIAGVSVSCVSLAKEGMIFFKAVNYFNKPTASNAPSDSFSEPSVSSNLLKPPKPYAGLGYLIPNLSCCTAHSAPQLTPT